MEKREYIITELEKINLTPEQILSHSFDDEIKTRLAKVVAVEYPITINLLFKRVLNSLGLEKLGSRLDEYFNNIVKETNLFSKLEIDKIVYYPNENAKCNYFRPSVEGARYSYQIPIIEGVNCIIYILERSNKSFYKTELLNQFAKEFNYERKGSQVVQLFENSRVMAKSINAIKESGNHKILL